MPTYDFEDKAGNPVTLFLEISDAPDYGEWRTYNGKKLKRVFERAHDFVAPHIPDYSCVIKSQAPWDPTYPRCNEMGNGVILNRKEHLEYKAKNPHLSWE